MKICTNCGNPVHRSGGYCDICLTLLKRVKELQALIDSANTVKDNWLRERGALIESLDARKREA